MHLIDFFCWARHLKTHWIKDTSSTETDSKSQSLYQRLVYDNIRTNWMDLLFCLVFLAGQDLCILVHVKINKSYTQLFDNKHLEVNHTGMWSKKKKSQVSPSAVKTLTIRTIRGTMANMPKKTLVRSCSLKYMWAVCINRCTNVQ